MIFRKNAVAIDFGAHAVRALDVTVSEKGVLVNRAVEVRRAELRAEGADPQDWKATARAIRSRLQSAGIGAKGVVLSLGGADTMIRYTRIPPVPSWRLKAIMDYEVREVSEKIGEPLASDYRVLELPREADEDQTILLALAKETPLQAALEAFEAAGMTIERAVPNALAIFSAHDAFGPQADPDSPEDDLLLLADLGAENLSIALVLNGKLAFARSVSFGGKNFTEALASSLKLTPEAAEDLKVNRGGLDERSRGVHYDTIPSLRASAGQLLGMLQSSLRFSSTQVGVKLPALSRAILLGGGMRLRGLDDFISSGLQAPASLFAPAGMRLAPGLAEPVSRALKERPGDFAVALGLGAARLQGGERADGPKTGIAVLPAKYRKRREFKDRTVFMYAAAAFLVICLIAQLAHGLTRRAKVHAVHAGFVAAHSQLQSQKRDLDETTKRAEARRARLNRVLREAEQTAFQAYVLDLLSRILRPEIQIETIALEAAASEAGAEIDYRLRIAGRVNNEKRQGLDWILDLQSALKADERIGSVEEESSRPEGAWYTFELSLTPNYVTY